jgi:hypothetical protein
VQPGCYFQKNSSEQVPNYINKKVKILKRDALFIHSNKTEQKLLKKFKFIYFLYVRHLLISLSNFFSTSIICFNFWCNKSTANDFCRFRCEISKNNVSNSN